MFDQFKIIIDPIADSVALSAIFAALPLLTLFVLLGVLRMKAWLAGLISLAVGLVVAIAVYAMPVGQALLSATEGAAFGFFPILWIVLNAIWVYNLTVVRGHFDVLRRSMERVSPDLRIQALIANTAAVAFGALATPIVTLGTVTHGASDDPRLTTETLGAMVGRQTPIVAVIVPLVLVAVVDGRRGVRQTWPAAAVSGLVFGVAQFVASNYISVPLTDIIASLLSAAAVVLLVRIWRPVESPDLHAEQVAREPGGAMLAGAGGRRDGRPATGRTRRSSRLRGEGAS